MKRAVSISIGSSKRNKAVEIELFGEKVSIERIGTDGDLEKAAQLYRELDGKVDAFGMGGTDLGLWVDKRWYNLYSTRKITRYIVKTPLVDGGGIKNTLEMRVARFLDQRLGHLINEKKVFVVSAVDRWGMAKSFLDAGYQCIFGDLMFGLGLPIPLRSERALKIAAALLMPIVGRLPYDWIYPTGEKQEEHAPKWEQYYQFGPVLAGDCHYIKRHLPAQLNAKIVVTNTTTTEDVEAFRRVGVKYLVTSTPVIDGRSFGTNMLEAALVAVAGKGRPLSMDEISQLIDQLGLEPQLQEIN
jgi:hypothetical protein